MLPEFYENYVVSNRDLYEYQNQLKFLFEEMKRK